MKRKIGWICLLFLLTGCNRYTEVNELGIVEVLAVTKEDTIKESASMILPKKEKNSYEILSSTGKSLGNAFNKLQNSKEKKIYFDQTQILLINPTILKEDVSQLIPFLLSHFKHPNWLTFLCDDCEDILKKEKNKTFYENLIRKENNRSGNSSITTFEDFSSLYLEETMTAYLPYLSIQNDEVQLEKMVAFTNDLRLISFSLEEAKIFFLLKEKSKIFEKNILLDHQNVSYSLTNMNSKIFLDKGDIHIHISGSYYPNDESSKDEDEEKDILEKQLAKDICSFIQKEALEKIDLLGIYHLFFLRDRREKLAQKNMQQAHYKIKISLKKEGGFN